MNDAVAAIMWTAMPLELVLATPEMDVAQCVDIAVDGRIVQVVPGTDGTGVVQRLISGNPLDYLDPRWQPGQTMSIRI